MRSVRAHHVAVVSCALAASCAGTGRLTTPSVPERADCVAVESLPYQLVGDERVVHLGARPGWAGRRVRLCPRDAPVGHVRFKVRDSTVELDCNGVVFDGSLGRRGRPVSRALDVDRSVHGMHDVTIRRCSFRAYRRGLVLSGPSIADDEAQALRRFRVVDTTVAEIDGGGILVGPHSRDFLFDGVEVRGTRLVGLYLNAYSRGTTVRNSRFVRNGYSDCSLGREAIAIDASSDNVIEDSFFANNRFAAIALYKNCGESGVARDMHANGNRIARNRFEGHCSPDGAAVFIASRQGVNIVRNDCLADDCLDPVLHDGRRRDYARFNTVADNFFAGNRVDLRIADDYNRVAGNVFEAGGCGQGSPRVIVGSAFLHAIGEPIRHVQLDRNEPRPQSKDWLRFRREPE